MQRTQARTTATLLLSNATLGHTRRRQQFEVQATTLADATPGTEGGSKTKEREKNQVLVEEERGPLETTSAGERRGRRDVHS